MSEADRRQRGRRGDGVLLNPPPVLAFYNGGRQCLYALFRNLDDLVDGDSHSVATKKDRLAVMAETKMTVCTNLVITPELSVRTSE